MNDHIPTDCLKFYLEHVRYFKSHSDCQFDYYSKKLGELLFVRVPNNVPLVSRKDIEIGGLEFNKIINELEIILPDFKSIHPYSKSAGNRLNISTKL